MKKAVPFLLAFILILIWGCGEKNAALPNFSQKIDCTVSFKYKATVCTVALGYFHGSLEANITSPPGMSRISFRGEGGRITLRCDDIAQSFDEDEISANSPVRLIYDCLNAAENSDYSNPSLLFSVNDDGGGTYAIHSETGDFMLTCNGDGMITRIEPASTDVVFTVEN